MAYYKLIRERPQGNAVRGTLYRVEHRFSRSVSVYKEYLIPICETMENAEHMIPALIYKVVVTMSPKFGRLLPMLQQVPGRKGIRFHRGDRPEHSEGCILVSREDEKSITAMWLHEQKNNEDTRLEICDFR